MEWKEEKEVLILISEKRRGDGADKSREFSKKIWEQKRGF